MNFYTLFTRTENVHLLKDVGMIPEKLAEIKPNVNSYLVTYKNGDYSYVGNQIKNVQLIFINKKFGKILDGIRFIRKNSDKIDVLNIYHLNLSSFFYCMAAKLFLKKDSVIYLKLDANNDEIRKIKKRDIRSLIKRRTIYMADLVSAETSTVAAELSQLVNKKIQWIPNGIFGLQDDKINASAKKNRIITVGRLGAYEKNTELIIDSFVKSCNKHNWELRLIGGYTPEIAEKIESLVNDYPDLAERILLTGEIFDRNKLRKEYEEAKIFLLPSKWESFSIALIEALEFGCFFISSGNVPLAKDVISFGAGGTIIEEYDPDEWAAGLSDICNSEINWGDLYKINKKIVDEKYNWNIIVENIFDYICNKTDN